MSKTYSSLFIHVVFSVKKRKPLIHPSWRIELYMYIAGIIERKTHVVYAIGGIEDHIHILISISPSIVISDLIREVKANSSKWINEKKFITDKFEWQGGFGVFSVDYARVKSLCDYIQNQEKHHRKIAHHEDFNRMKHENYLIAKSIENEKIKMSSVQC